MDGEVWTVRRCMDWTVDYLSRLGDERPRLTAEWLLGAATGLKRIELYMNMDRPLSAEERGVMHHAVVRRRSGEPLQYIVGETAFRSLDVWCEPGVLIPRPETEMLVEVVLEHLDRAVLNVGPEGFRAWRERIELPWNAEVDQARREEAERLRQERAETSAEGAAADEASAEADGDVPAPASQEVPAQEALPHAANDPAAADELPCARVLEVGCGTGCIALSLVAERPNRVTCVAIDIDEHACDLARRNRDRHALTSAEVDIRQGDLVAPVRPDEFGTFDVLVSNPPYIPSAVMADLPREVAQFEPHLALDGGADGLDVFRRLLAAAPQMLRPGGLLACELFEDATEPAAELCRAAGFEEVRVVSDLTRRPRFVLARVPMAR